MGRRALLITGGVIAFLALAYLGAGYVIYDQLSRVTHGGGENASYTPAQFDMGQWWPDFDTSDYLMPDFETVTFPSRQTDVSLTGWYVRGRPGAPGIVVTHGISQCKCQPNVLLAAGMLHRNGFNVLLFDLRNHGESEITTGRTAIGNSEYLDVLGAWDWLRTSQGLDPQRIGLYGQSLGAGTTLIAFGAEPAIAALFVDSPYSRLDIIINEELARNGYPTMLAPAAIVAARIVSGDDLLAHSPEEGIRLAGSRPIYIVHGTADERIDVHHTRDLARLGESVGADVSVWLPEGVTHVDAEEMMPDEYEQRLVDFFEQSLQTP